MKRMQLIIFGLLTLLLLLSVQTVFARNTLHEFPFQEVVERGKLEGVLSSDVRFYLAGKSHPGVSRTHGEYKTNKKTNAFNKSDKEACAWALLSALKSLQQRALSLSANAVINIKSNYKSKEFSSPTEYQCGAGAFLAGVALKGTVAQIK